MRPLLLGLALLGADVALVAERVAVVCVAGSTPAAAVPVESLVLSADKIFADCFLDLERDDLVVLLTAAAPREFPADCASHHPFPQVWKPP